MVHGGPYSKVGYSYTDHDEEFDQQGDPVIGRIQLMDNLGQGNG